MSRYKSTNWKDWIYERFGDTAKYKITFHEEYAEYSVNSANSKIETTIYFSFMNNEDNDVLYDIQFSRNREDDTYRWVSPFTIDKEYKPTLLEQLKVGSRLETSLFFNEKFVNRLEKEWLAIPIQQGWKEELIFIGNKVFRAKLKVKGSTNIWDKNENNWDLLSNWDLLKLLLGIGKNTRKYDCEKIE